MDISLPSTSARDRSSHGSSTLTPELLRSALEASSKSLHSTNILFKKSEEKLNSLEVFTKERFLLLEERIKFLEERTTVNNRDQRSINSNGIQTTGLLHHADEDTEDIHGLLLSMEPLAKEDNMIMNGFDPIPLPKGKSLSNGTLETSIPRFNGNIHLSDSHHNSSSPHSSSPLLSPPSPATKALPVMTPKAVKADVTCHPDIDWSSPNRNKEGTQSVQASHVIPPTSINSASDSIARSLPASRPNINNNGFHHSQSCFNLIDIDTATGPNELNLMNGSNLADSAKTEGIKKAEKACQTDAVQSKGVQIDLKRNRLLFMTLLM